MDAPTTEEEIKNWIEWHPGVKMYVTENGTTGAVTPDGDMIALSSNKGEGTAMFEWQIKNGGFKLDSYDSNYGLYRKLGFEINSWTPFNPEVNKHWKPNYLPEDVVFMTYKGSKSQLSSNIEEVDENYIERELNHYKSIIPASVDSPKSNGETDWGYDKAKDIRNNYVDDNKKELKKEWDNNPVFNTE